MEAIAYHEGIPGHHLQFSIAQEINDLPAFRRYGDYNSYSEGWALYAETLAHEMGFYQDPYSEYGRLQNLMWRSIRLVVDTGVHSQHWSRQQMIDFFHVHTAMDDQNIETEVDRYNRLARSGAGLQARRNDHSAHAHQSSGKAERQVRHQSLSRCGAGWRPRFRSVFSNRSSTHGWMRNEHQVVLQGRSVRLRNRTDHHAVVLKVSAGHTENVTTQAIKI